MKFFLFTCVAVAAAQYSGADLPAYPQPPAGPYNAPQSPPEYQIPGYPPTYPDYDRDHDHHHGGFRKLRDLKGEGLYEADIRYFRRNGDTFAAISCSRPTNATLDDSLWVVADAHRPTTSPIFPAGVLVLAGGANIDYVVKFVDGKWEGADYAEDDKHRFRKVACYFRDGLSFGLTPP